VSKPAGRAALTFIFVSIVLDIVAFGIVIPVLPKLIESFVNFDAATAARWVGLFGTIWALMQFICAPVLGALSDHFGRRPVLLLSIAGLGFDYIFMALAPTLGWLLVGRIVSGMTASGFATASAYIADVTEPENRAAAFGLVGAAWGFGFVVGPALGGVLGASDPRLPFWVAGGLALVNALYGFFLLPESLPPEKRAVFSWARANPLGSLRFLRAHRELLPLAGVSFLYNLGHTVYPSVFVLWAGYVLGWGAKEVGYALAIVGIANVVVQGGVVRPMIKRLGARTALGIGATAGTIGFTLYGLTNVTWVIWIAIVVYAPAGVFNPSLMGVMSKRVGPSGQGRLQGATSSLMGIAGMLGPALFTLSFAAMIRPESRWHLPGLPFFLAAVLFAAAGLVAMRVTREGEA
jgi:DHA1 family tetracycline resistance protein-like MFS transporter